MTTNTDKALSEIFDVELTTTDKSVGELAIIAKAEEIDNVEKQREYVRKNMVALLEKGTAALETMISIAGSTESGKDFDVVSRLLKTMVESNAKLMELELAGKNVAPTVPNGVDAPKQNASTINNTAYFVGTTADMAKYAKTNGTIFDNTK